MEKSRIYQVSHAFEGEFDLSLDGNSLGQEVRGKIFTFVEHSAYQKAVDALRKINDHSWAQDLPNDVADYAEQTLKELGETE